MVNVIIVTKPSLVDLRYFFNFSQMMTSFVASMIRMVRLQPERDGAAIKDLEDCVEKLVDKFRGKSLSQQMLSTLFLTRLALSSDIEDVVGKTVKSLSTKNDLKDYYSFTCDAAIKLTPTESVVVEKFLKNYVDLAKSITIDFWIDLVDEETRSLLQHPILGIW